MKRKIVFSNLLLLALFLVLAPAALASTTWYVNGVTGSDSNNCLSPQTACKTITHAISLASSGDSIVVAAATYKENLTIGKSLTILGSGTTTAIIDGGGVATVVTISSSGALVTLSNFTIRNGAGGGIYNSGALRVIASALRSNFAAYFGGGIYNNLGTLTVHNSTISGNTVVNTCVGYCKAFGGGIYNYGGTVTISTSTLNGNRATCKSCGAAAGGGVFNVNGTVTINNSTLSGNSVAGRGGYGGGIYNNSKLSINNTTLSGNSASGSGGGVYEYDGEGTVTFQNSIVANSPSGGNCSGTMTSNGYNLSSDNTCNFNGPGDLNDTNPMLGPLQNNGGPTQTMALPSGSPAVDAGNPSGCTDGQGHLLKTDQRGQPRPDAEDAGGCDMGAYERQSD